MSIKRAAELYLDHVTNHTSQALRKIRKNGGKDQQALVLDPKWIVFALTYLNAFGYFLKALETWKNVKLSDVQAAIEAFQKFFKLKPSGYISERELRVMNYPRCGFPDVCRDRSDQKQFYAIRRWAQQNLPAWRKRNLRFFVTGYVGGIPQERQRQLLANAFNAWTQHGNITAEPTSSASSADVLIGVGQGRAFNFDGPGGVLAWAYLPDGSDRQLVMRFDLAETWIETETQRGILYFNVACHEIGHIFGLDHSRVASALMAPTYNPRVAVPQANDDIPRFQARYGRRTSPPPTPTPTQRSLTVRFVDGNPVIELDGKRLA